MKKPKPTLETIVGRVKLYEEKVQDLEYTFQEDKAPEAALKLAQAKQALLATHLLLWICCRLSDIRLLVVNWDIAAVRESNGSESVFVAPMQDKTNWRLRTAVQVKDVGKKLHANVASLYWDYLRRHRPVLLRNLGTKARYDITFRDEAHGPGASNCMTLFPGYWHDSQVSAFTQKLIQPVAGTTERVIRQEISKELSRHAKEWGVHKESVHQTLHHSEKVHNEAYLTGIRNDANELQAWLLHWR